jgi:hypothetical protein
LGLSQETAMPIEPYPISLMSGGRVVASGGAELRPTVVAAARAEAAEAAAAPPADPPVVRPVEPTQALDRASRAAARAIFEDRDVEVTSFRDQGTGRIVYRVADKASGEVLLQSPPDALLRFFASTRAALADPLLAVEA